MNFGKFNDSTSFTRPVFDILKDISNRMSYCPLDFLG